MRLHEWFESSKIDINFQKWFIEHLFAVVGLYNFSWAPLFFLLIRQLAKYAQDKMWLVREYQKKKKDIWHQAASLKEQLLGQVRLAQDSSPSKWLEFKLFFAARYCYLKFRNKVFVILLVFTKNGLLWCQMIVLHQSF